MLKILSNELKSKNKTMTSKLQLQSKIQLRGKGKSWSSLCRAQYLKFILVLFVHINIQKVVAEDFFWPPYWRYHYG